MPINILMPALSPTMEKGNLAKWLKKEGDTVKSGDVIAEIETDKATMEVEAVDEGVIAKILVPEGTQDVPVNDVIAVMAGDGEDVKAAGAGAASPAPQTNGHARIFSSPLARRLAKEAGIELGRINGSGPHGRVVARSRQFVPELLRGTVVPFAGLTPYARLRNWPVLGTCLALLLGAAAWSRRRPSR